MTIDKKVWFITILIIIGTNMTIYLTVPSWQNQVLLYFLSFSLLLPISIAYKKMKQLLINDEESTIQQDKLIKQIKQLEEKTNQQNQFIQGIAAPVFSLDVDDNQWFASKNMIDLLELTNQDLPLNMDDLEKRIHIEDKQQYFKDKEAWLSGTPTTSEYRIVREDDEQIFWIEIRTNIEVDSSGKVTKIYGIVIDVTKQKEKAEMLEQMAFYDSLTNLPNRIMLKSHLKKAISRAKRREHDITIMFLDLDGFKQINDTMGHDIGDALKEVANRLNESIREEDLISRLGGDEFIIVIEETNKEEVTAIADRVLNNTSIPYSILNNTVSISPSIGISSYPDDGLDIESLIKNADKAMYLAKDKGKGNYQFYTKDLEDYQPKESLIDKVLKFFQK